MVDVEQGSEEWVKIRLGKVTASNVHKVLAKPRKRGQTESTTRRNYISQLAIEILTGKSAEPQITNWHMERGMNLEPKARAAYELQCQEMVLTAGFVEHPRIPRFGCSPDALVGSKGLAQFKCPILAIHYEYIKAAKIQKVPSDYFAQVQCELACMPEREFNDFSSYNEQYPAGKRLVIIHSERDAAYIKELEAAVIEFNMEVDEMVNDLRGIEPPDLETQLKASLAQFGITQSETDAVMRGEL